MANLMAAAATSDLSEVVVARAISGHFTQPAICVWLDWRTAKFLLVGKGRKEEITLLKHWCFALLKARSVFYVLFCSSSATGNTTGVNYTESVLSPVFWRRYKSPALIVSHATISFLFSNHTVWENLKLNESEELALDFFSL